jgi:hypothetical protein
MSGIFFFHTNNGSELECFREENCRLPRKTFYSMMNQVWSQPKRFLYVKLDDQNYCMKPFFQGFDHLNICNVNLRAMAGGDCPESINNVISLQASEGMFDPPEEETDAKGCPLKHESNPAKLRKARLYTPQGAAMQINKRIHKNGGTVSKRGPGRPKGSKNKPKRVTFDPATGMMILNRSSGVARRDLLPTECLSMRLYNQK